MQPHIPRLRQTSIRSARLELSAVMVACALFPPMTLKGAVGFVLSVTKALPINGA